MNESTAVRVAVAGYEFGVSGQNVANTSRLRSKFEKFATTDRRVNFRKRFEAKGFSPSHRSRLDGRVSQYDASTGRWLTKDPIRFNGGDTNLYGYVLNDPINFIDPDGLMTKKAPEADPSGDPPQVPTPFDDSLLCREMRRKCGVGTPCSGYKDALEKLISCPPPEGGGGGNNDDGDSARNGGGGGGISSCG